MHAEASHRFFAYPSFSFYSGSSSTSILSQLLSSLIVQIVSNPARYHVPQFAQMYRTKKIEGPTVWACEQQCATSCHTAVTESQLFKRGHRFSGPLCLLSVRERPGWGTLLIPQLRLGRVLCSLVGSFFSPLSSDTLVQRREKNELRWWEMTKAGSALHQIWRIKLFIQVVNHQYLQVKPFSLTNRVNDFKLG